MTIFEESRRMLSNRDATQLIKAIVEHQMEIVGPLAIEQANKVSGIQVSGDLQSVSVSGEVIDTLKKLVDQYEELFGQASVEVCKDAIKEILPQLSQRDLPDFLK